MTSRELLGRAASLISSEGAYSRHASGSPSVATTRCFSATGALERSARTLRSGSAFLGASDTAALIEAKNAVCRAVGFPHIDMWEAVERPDWQGVRSAFLEAA